MKKLTSKKTIIFDMDGTLADSFDIFVDINNQNYQEIGTKFVDEDFKAKIKNMTEKELLEEMDVDWYEIPKIAIKYKVTLEEAFLKSKAFPQIPETVKALKEKGYTLGIISRNNEENIESFIKANQLDFFDFYKSTSIFSSKSKSMESLIKEYNLSKDKIVYVGDVVKDLKASKEVGVTFVFVTWGFNSLELVEPYRPDFVVNNPQELLSLFID